jgi:isocitrate dehydrogenase (NAD+)
MLKDLQELNAAARIQKAVEDVLVEGKVRTRDIGGTASTTEFTEAIASKL